MPNILRQLHIVVTVFVFSLSPALCDERQQHITSNKLSSNFVRLYFEASTKTKEWSTGSAVRIGDIGTKGEECFITDAHPLSGNGGSWVTVANTSYSKNVLELVQLEGVSTFAWPLSDTELTESGTITVPAGKKREVSRLLFVRGRSDGESDGFVVGMVRNRFDEHSHTFDVDSLRSTELKSPTSPLGGYGFTVLSGRGVSGATFRPFIELVELVSDNSIVKLVRPESREWPRFTYGDRGAPIISIGQADVAEGKWDQDWAGIVADSSDSPLPDKTLSEQFPQSRGLLLRGFVSETESTKSSDVFSDKKKNWGVGDRVSAVTAKASLFEPRHRDEILAALKSLGCVAPKTPTTLAEAVSQANQNRSGTSATKSRLTTKSKSPRLVFSIKLQRERVRYRRNQRGSRESRRARTSSEPIQARSGNGTTPAPKCEPCAAGTVENIPLDKLKKVDAYVYRHKDTGHYVKIYPKLDDCGTAQIVRTGQQLNTDLPNGTPKMIGQAVVEIDGKKVPAIIMQNLGSAGYLDAYDVLNMMKGKLTPNQFQSFIDTELFGKHAKLAAAGYKTLDHTAANNYMILMGSNDPNKPLTGLQLIDPEAIVRVGPSDALTKDMYDNYVKAAKSFAAENGQADVKIKSYEEFKSAVKAAGKPATPPASQQQPCKDCASNRRPRNAIHESLKRMRAQISSPTVRASMSAQAQLGRVLNIIGLYYGTLQKLSSMYTAVTLEAIKKDAEAFASAFKEWKKRGDLCGGKSECEIKRGLDYLHKIGQITAQEHCYPDDDLKLLAVVAYDNMLLELFLLEKNLPLPEYDKWLEKLFSDARENWNTKSTPPQLLFTTVMQVVPTNESIRTGFTVLERIAKLCDDRIEPAGALIPSIFRVEIILSGGKVELYTFGLGGYEKKCTLNMTWQEFRAKYIKPNEKLVTVQGEEQLALPRPGGSYLDWPTKCPLLEELGAVAKGEYTVECPAPAKSGRACEKLAEEIRNVVIMLQAGFYDCKQPRTLKGRIVRRTSDNYEYFVDWSQFVKDMDELIQRLQGLLTELQHNKNSCMEDDRFSRYFRMGMGLLTERPEKASTETWLKKVCVVPPPEPPPAPPAKVIPPPPVVKNPEVPPAVVQPGKGGTDGAVGIDNSKPIDTSVTVIDKVDTTTTIITNSGNGSGITTTTTSSEGNPVVFGPMLPGGFGPSFGGNDSILTGTGPIFVDPNVINGGTVIYSVPSTESGPDPKGTIVGVPAESIAPAESAPIPEAVNPLDPSLIIPYRFGDSPAVGADFPPMAEPREGVTP